MISPLLPEHHRQGREHALVFSVEASLNFLSRPYSEATMARIQVPEEALEVTDPDLSAHLGEAISLSAQAPPTIYTEHLDG